MRVDGDRRQSFRRDDVAQVLPEIRLVDRQVVMERQDDGRDDAMRDVGLVAGHSWSPSARVADLTAGIGLLCPKIDWGGNAMIRSKILAAFALALAAPALAGEAAPKDFAAHTELYPIHTLTLSDKQFLTGDAEAKPVDVGGVLRLPPA